MTDRLLRLEAGSDHVTLRVDGAGVRSRRYRMTREQAAALSDLLARAAAGGSAPEGAIGVDLPGEARHAPADPDRRSSTPRPSAPKPGPRTRPVPPPAESASAPAAPDPAPAAGPTPRRALMPHPVPAPPPGDAVYSVVSGRAIPTAAPRPLTVPAEGVSVIGVETVTQAELEAAVAQPEDTWTTDVGHSDYYLRGRLAVRVTRADHLVEAIQSRAYALSRRPDLTREPESGQGRSASGGAGTRYPTNRHELLDRLARAGFEVTTSGATHGKITHPDHPGLVVPLASSPSDRRHGRHMVTQIKRVFGIDLRES